MTSGVIKGHIRLSFYLRIHFFFVNFFLNLILSKLFMGANIMKKQISHKMKYDLKDHTRSQYGSFMLRIFSFSFYDMFFLLKL